MGLLYEINMVLSLNIIMTISIVGWGLANLSQWSEYKTALTPLIPMGLLSLFEGKHIYYIAVLLFTEVNLMVLTFASLMCSVGIRHLLGWWTRRSGPIPLLRSVQETSSALRYVKSTVMSGFKHLIRWCSGDSSPVHGVWPWYEMNMAMLYVISIVLICLSDWISNLSIPLAFEVHFYVASMTVPVFYPVLLMSIAAVGIRYVISQWTGYPYPGPILLILLLYEMNMAVLMGISTGVRH